MMRRILLSLSVCLGLAVIDPFRTNASAADIDFVEVGDPGNIADSTGYGSVADAFRIMKFEWTNTDYVEFLNSVDPDGTNPNAIYSTVMSTDISGGIDFAPGAQAGSKYSVKTNFGDKPVNFVSWFDAARVANWLHNGAQSYGSSDASSAAPQNVGAYSLGTAVSGSAFAKNADALYWLPSENEWYKAAYYKGGSTNAGYWNYATQFDTTPTQVFANANGDGLAGPTGNFANYEFGADWNGKDGLFTTVGTNGGPSAYGAFDMSGNIYEWNDLDSLSGSSRGFRGGSWVEGSASLSRNVRLTDSPDAEYSNAGFRLATVVPEPSSIVLSVASVCVAMLISVRSRGQSKWKR
jgi:formylglycine-generating enzyme required for sulfatase activity